MQIFRDRRTSIPVFDNILTSVCVDAYSGSTYLGHRRVDGSLCGEEGCALRKEIRPLLNGVNVKETILVLAAIVTILIGVITFAALVRHWSGGDSRTSVRSATPSATATPFPVAIEVGLANCPATYTVQPGDTLVDIANAYSVSLEKLQDKNGIRVPGALQVDEVIIIPCKGIGGVATEDPDDRPKLKSLLRDVQVCVRRELAENNVALCIGPIVTSEGLGDVSSSIRRLADRLRHRSLVLPLCISSRGLEASAYLDGAHAALTVSEEYTIASSAGTKIMRAIYKIDASRNGSDWAISGWEYEFVDPITLSDGTVAKCTGD